MSSKRTHSGSKPIAPMKQAQLTFASKRTTSSGSASKSSKAAPGKTQLSRASSISATYPALHSSDTIELSDNSAESSAEEGEPRPAPKRRRLAGPARKEATGTSDSADDDAAGVVREPLDVRDRRWRKLYGAARDEMGNLEPVHAQGQTMVDHILRVFDLSYQYGPCVGVSRLDRWERAHALGLEPPTEVKDILVSKEGSTDERYTQSVFHGEV